MNEIGRELDEWAHSNEKTFNRFRLLDSGVTISRNAPLWKPTQYQSDHPGIAFFDDPPTIITRNFSYPLPGKTTECPPDTKSFVFTEKRSPDDNRNVNDFVKQAPPLLSVFPNTEIIPINDTRKDVGLLKPGEIFYTTAAFNGISSVVKLFEPIIVSAFVWDTEKCIKISETWQFLANRDSVSHKVLQNIDQNTLDSPLTVSIPATKAHPQSIFVMTLERLVVRDGGANLTKYYAKQSNSNLSTATKDIEACSQQNTTMTFAYMTVPMSDLISQGDAIRKSFDQFFPATSVSDQSLKNLVAIERKSREKPLPFKLSMTFSMCDHRAVKLRNYFNFAPAPYTTFENELIIHVKQARFHFPRGVRGRNVLMEIRLIEGNNSLPVFNDNTVFTSRVQYHVENPTFQDEIIIQLPLTLQTNTFLHVQFFHASVKPNCAQPREPCGESIIPLFMSGAIFADGEHKAGIRYGSDEVPSENDTNVFIFESKLRSCVFSTDPFAAKVFHHDMKNTPIPSESSVMPNLYALLDEIIWEIQVDNPEAFETLLKLLSLFVSDRENAQCQYLVYYLQYCALRKPQERAIHHKLVMLWTSHLAETMNSKSFQLKRPDFTCSWFLLELITKSLILDSVDNTVDCTMVVGLLQTLSSLIPRFQKETIVVGQTLNKHIALFAKDLSEITNKGIAAQIVINHLAFLDLKRSLYDRTCFREFFEAFVSPKVLIFLLAPIEIKGHTTSLFNFAFLHHFEDAFDVEEHTNDLFNRLFNLLLQFDPTEHQFLAPELSGILSIIGRNEAVLRKYSHRELLLFPFTVAHFVLYYAPPKDLVGDAVKCVELILTQGKHTTIAVDTKLANQSQGTTSITMTSMENMTAVMTASLKSDDGTAKLNEQATTRRRFWSLSMRNRPDFLKPGATTDSPERSFDGLSFAMQALSILFIESYHSTQVLNHVICPMFDIPVAPALEPCFLNAVKQFASEQQPILFKNPESNIKHVIHRIFQNITPGRIELVEFLRKVEVKEYSGAYNTDAFVTRSLYKAKITEELVEQMKDTSYHKIAKKMFDIRTELANKELAKSPDFYSDKLFELAEVVSASPDCRVDSLLQLANYHIEHKYFSEALMALLSCAAIVAEYLYILGRIPAVYSENHPARCFMIVCPCAEAECCGDKKVKHLPQTRGFCRSKYFCEYGLIYLIQTAMDTSKRAELYEILSKLHHLMGPVAESRHVWKILERTFNTGVIAWGIVSKFSTSTDRILGSYYRVQFQGLDDVFIYREMGLNRLQDAGNKIAQSAAVIAGGKQVVVVYQGDELDSSTFDNDHFYVHVKAVQPYFTNEEKRTRITVFEQNFNIRQFFYDMPIYQGGKNLENISLKRTIFTPPQPLPYILKRIKVPQNDIKTIILSPIERCNDNLQNQIARINEALVRKDTASLQPLIQGSLLTQVNEGPKKMAEVFLAGCEDNEHTAIMVDLFREFLRVNQEGVALHATYAATNPMYTELQEQLEQGLNMLTSSLQPYLK